MITRTIAYCLPLFLTYCCVGGAPRRFGEMEGKWCSVGANKLWASIKVLMTEKITDSGTQVVKFGEGAYL